MMTTYRNLSVFFWLGLWLIVSCSAPEEKKPEPIKNRIFFLADSTRLELPSSFYLAEKLDGKNQFVTEIFDDFSTHLESPAQQVAFFLDSLLQNRILAVYKVDYQDFNQNMAALWNTRLTQQFQKFDENHPCYKIKKVESMQYASKVWNALKFKFQNQLGTLKECGDTPRESFLTIFYYNGNHNAYFCVEYNLSKEDLDSYLRHIRIGPAF